ncbi:MFS transporter [Prolixibacteraceae bacterium]|nr:MFS transporter [Prolixibacteraceae bacterium]
MHRNIVQLYLIKAAKWFMLAMPVIMLFYESAHLDVQQVFILKAIYSLMVVLCEIPSGYLSDVWGRKNALVLGTILGALGYSCYAFFTGFWFFLIAEVLLGIGQSFISGSDSALLYDTLNDEERTSDYLMIEGRITSWGNFLEAIAGLMAGFLASYSIRYPMIGQAFVSLIGIPAALMLREPSSSLEHRIASIKEVVGVVKSSFVQHLALRNSLLFSSIIGTATLTMAWLLQLLFKEMLIPVSQYGVLWTALNLIVAWGCIRAYYIEKRVHSMWLSIIILIGIVGGYLSIGFVKSYWVFAFVVVFYLTRGIATPTLKNMVNQHTASSVRATVLSIRNFLIRILFAAIGPVLGGVTDSYGLRTSMMVMGLVIFFLGSTVLMLEWHRIKTDGL